MSNRPDHAHAAALAEAARTLGHAASYDVGTGALLVDGVRVDGMVTQHKAVLTVSDGTTPRDYKPLAATGIHNYASAAKLLIAYAERKRSGYPIIIKRPMTAADWAARKKYLAANRERLRPPRVKGGGQTDSVYGRRRGVDGKLP